jgi:hypothetical protein
MGNKVRFRDLGYGNARAWRGEDHFDGLHYNSVGRGMVLTKHSLVFFSWSAPRSDAGSGPAIAEMMAMTMHMD